MDWLFVVLMVLPFRLWFTSVRSRLTLAATIAGRLDGAQGMTKVQEWCGQRTAAGEHCHGLARPPLAAVWRDLCALPRLPGNRRKGGSATDVQTKGRAQQTASNLSGKSALLAAPRFYKKRNRRDGVAVAMTTRFCFVSRAAAGVTAI